MESIILVIHLIIALSIIAIIMIQPSEAGGFLGTGSMANAGAPRRRGDVLSRTTTILAGVFFVTSLLLALYASHRPAGTSILDAAGDDQAVVTDTVKSPVTDANDAAEPNAQELTNESAEKIADKPAEKPAAKPAAPKAVKTPKAPIGK